MTTCYVAQSQSSTQTILAIGRCLNKSVDYLRFHVAFFDKTKTDADPLSVTFGGSCCLSVDTLGAVPKSFCTDYYYLREESGWAWGILFALILCVSCVWEPSTFYLDSLLFSSMWLVSVKVWQTSFYSVLTAVMLDEKPGKGLCCHHGQKLALGPHSGVPRTLMSHVQDYHLLLCSCYFVRSSK